MSAKTNPQFVEFNDASDRAPFGAAGSAAKSPAPIRAEAATTSTRR
jgi:hypothetical protein